MEISNVNSQLSTPHFGGVKRTEISKEVAPKAANATKDAIVEQQQVKDLPKAEKERFEMMQKGSEMFRNFYAVSDTTFTIFRDSSGQFVTRFTKLDDNSVTYLPEPDVARFMESSANRRAAIFELEA